MIKDSVFHTLGLMSGTSLDGVDVALCTFSNNEGRWKYVMECAETIPYNAYWKDKLSRAHQESTLDFLNLHNEYGVYLGRIAKSFLLKNNKKAGCISSHGHTIFHQPEKKLTFQLGSGAAICAEARLPVTCDFRSLDIALGGQGAPLVPAGDKLLFQQYTFCLNLGGFVNVSFDKNNTRIAFDICPLNIVSNHYSHLQGKEYDAGGEMGKAGNIHTELLAKLDSPALYKTKGAIPASLSREWLENHFLPLVDSYIISIPDKLRTVYEHAATRISRIMNEQYPDETGSILVSGGGVYNSFFIERLTSHSRHRIVIPDDQLIQFKEALIFAFLGTLRINREINVLKSVTGALQDHSGGSIYSP